MKTSELQGAALDWAVATLEGVADRLGQPKDSTAAREFAIMHPDDPYLQYSTRWAQGGPIIEREKIRLDCAWSPGPWKGSCKIDGHTAGVEGATPLIAAMRYYVASKLGDEVEIPEELK